MPRTSATRRGTAWFVSALLLTAAASAAELKQSTIDAWDAYIQQAAAHMQQRGTCGKPFLWVDEDPARRHAARDGEILVVPVGGHTPVHVPNGLIHDWLGAAFLPGVTLDEVTGVLRDYERYTEYYSPSVIDAKRVHKGRAEDRFSLVLRNRSFFLKTALSGEYQSSYVRIDARREYSFSRTIGLQEIEDFGEPDQKAIPAGQGSGYIWRLASISRFEERDGGVYVEVEAMALSRDIPFSVRWLVDPIVRRVSRGALLTSFRQTKAAVSAKMAENHREPEQPPQACDVPAVCSSNAWTFH